MNRTSTPRRRPKHRRSRARRSAALAIGLITATGIAWNASYAAFSDKTTNGSNDWAAGTVEIDNNQSGSAVFSVNAVRPDASLTSLNQTATDPFAAGSTDSGGTACIRVAYTGSMTADIKMYATITSTGSVPDNGGLDDYLLFSVDTGTNTGDPTADVACTNFVSSNSYLHGAATNNSTYLKTVPANYATGLGGWNGATAGSAKWYRLSWLLPANVSDNAQGQRAQVTFTWEAQS